jgi:outer membrane protein
LFNDLFMKTIQVLPFFFFFLLITNCGIGQQSVLENYIKEALANNLAIKGSQLQRNKQLSKIEQARKNWLPSVDANANYLLSEGGRTILFPVGDLFNPVYGTLNQLTQSNQFPTDLQNENIPLTPNDYLDLQLKITQPILNSSIKYNQLLQQELLKLNDVDIQIQEKEIIFQTSTAYYNYLKTIEGFKILEETDILLNDLLEINQKLVKYDKATPDVVSDIEYRLANLESEKAKLREQQSIARTYFNILLNQEIETPIEVDTKILSSFTTQQLSLKKLIAEAQQNRLEFQSIEIANTVIELNKERINKEKLPTLGVSGAVGLQTEGFDFATGGPIYTLGFGMAVNLFDSGRRNKRIEEINVDQNILYNNRAQLQQQIEIEVSQIYFSLQSLSSKLVSDRAASKSAQRSYAIIKSKYENDKAILLEVTNAQNQLITSSLREVLTKYDYLIKLVELEKAIQ